MNEEDEDDSTIPRAIQEENWNNATCNSENGVSSYQALSVSLSLSLLVHPSVFVLCVCVFVPLTCSFNSKSDRAPERAANVPVRVMIPPIKAPAPSVP